MPLDRVRCPSCQVTIRFRHGRPDSPWINCPQCGGEVHLAHPGPPGSPADYDDYEDADALDPGSLSANELVEDGWADEIGPAPARSSRSDADRFDDRDHDPYGDPYRDESSSMGMWLGAAAMACVLLVALVVGARAVLSRGDAEEQPANKVADGESAPAQAERPGDVGVAIPDQPVPVPAAQPVQPVQPMPVGGPPAVPAAVAGDGLRYRWQPGKEYAFRVKITADLGDETQHVTGQWNYRVEAHKRNAAVVADEAARADGAAPVGVGRHFVLNHTGHFTSSRRRDRPGLIGPPSFPTSKSDRCRVIVDETGQVIEIEGESESLPLVIEPMATFVLDPLPRDGRTKWTIEEQRMLARIEREEGIFAFGPRRIAPPRIGPRIGPRFGPRFGRDPFADREKVTVFPAKERREYTITESTPETVVIHRKFELNTTEKAAGVPVLNLTGVGTIRFDRAESLPQRIQYDMLLKIESDNVAVRVPFEVECNRLTEQELADARQQAQKAMEEAQRRAAKQKKKENAPETLAEHLKTISELTPAGEFSKRYVALGALKRMTPADHAAAQKDVIAALEPLREDSNSSIRTTALQAYVHWAGQDEMDELIELAGHDDFFVRRAVIEKLGQLGGKKAAAAVAPQLTELRYRGDATKALIAIGADAEKDVLKLADADDYQTRSSAYEVLGKIGGKKSRELLTKRADEEPHFAAKLAAKRALESLGTDK